MGVCVVDIHGEIEGDCDVICDVPSIDDFIKFAKEQFGVELIVKKSNNPDTFEKIFE